MPELNAPKHNLIQGGYKSPSFKSANVGRVFNVFDPDHPDKPGLLLKKPAKKKDEANGFVIRGTVGRHGCLEFQTDIVSTWAGPDHIGPLSIFLPGSVLEVSPIGMMSPDWACVVEVV